MYSATDMWSDDEIQYEVSETRKVRLRSVSAHSPTVWGLMTIVGPLPTGGYVNVTTVDDVSTARHCQPNGARRNVWQHDDVSHDVSRCSDHEAAVAVARQGWAG
jgi:hypothetical protein